MYNKQKQRNHCAHEVVSNLRSRDLTKAELKAKLSEEYEVDVEDTEVAIRRVVSILCLSEYFLFAFGKQLIEARHKELQELRTNQARYDGWKAGSKKVPFSAIVVSIDFVLINLK